MPATHHHSAATLQRGFMATGLATLVFVLGLMSVSPTLHAWVHRQAYETAGEHAPTHNGSQPYDANHSCAIVSFAQGLTIAVDAVLPDTLPTVWHEKSFPVALEPSYTAPQFRLPSERAPPIDLS